MKISRFSLTLAALVAAASLTGTVQASFADQTLLNVSYDPTRELYKDYNAAFAAHWKAETGETVTIRASHGGSGKQARSVIDGIKADVVTLALESDIDAIAALSGKIDKDWRKRLPNNSAPYTSTIVFLVRKGNPKGIKDWGDLVKDGVEVITPNPKTSGGARWNYLAAWARAYKQYGGDEQKIKDYIGELFRHVPVLDTGARGSTTTFVQRQLGDVLLCHGKTKPISRWLNLARMHSTSSFRRNPFWLNRRSRWWTRMQRKTVPPSWRRPILNICIRRKVRRLPPSISTVRRSLTSSPADKQRKFPDLTLVTIDDPIFGGWAKAQPYHFGDGGTFDQLYKPGK